MEADNENRRQSQRKQQSLAIISLCILFASCTMVGRKSPEESANKTRAAQHEQDASRERSHKDKSPWYQGSVEKAFAQAKSTRKPILLYWGAVWCPPCNEMKAEVFSKPKFKDLTRPMLAVYLDGDSERAQIWADKLKVKGYPTILVLDADGRELSRIASGVNLEEFTVALNGALAAPGTASAPQPMKTRIENALAGKANESDWKILAHYSWGQATDFGWTPKKMLEVKQQLATRAPSKLAKEKAILNSLLLEAAASVPAEKLEAKAVAEKIKKIAPNLVNTMLANAATIKACRSVIIYSSADILGWAFPLGSKGARAARERWLAAARTLQNDPSLSVDTRLWAVYPHLALALEQKPGTNKGKKKSKSKSKQVIPAETKTLVKKAVAAADRRAISRYDRHAVISGAAYLLQKVDDFDGARQLLRKELAITDTPWYYQSSFAALEREAGNDTAALTWSEKARKSAKGRATRLQWLVNDLALTSKLKNSQQETRLLSLLDDYYRTAFALADGFAGRNRYRSEIVAKNLKDWIGNEKVKGTVRTWSKKCQGVDKTSLEGCEKHFQGLLTQSRS